MTQSGLKLERRAIGKLTIGILTGMFVARACAAVTFSVNVKNTGIKEGTEVVDLYTRQVKSSVPLPLKALCGFGRAGLKPEETRSASLSLNGNQLACSDVNTHGFVVEFGAHEVLIGRSLVDIRRKTRFEGVKPSQLNEHQDDAELQQLFPPQSAVRVPEHQTR
jgi:Fibronectin type III-like domain